MIVGVRVWFTLVYGEVWVRIGEVFVIVVLGWG